jgi:dTDP-glucose 4,6-dehydratase
MAEYLPKSILVTGGAGFIASHVVSLIAERHPEYSIVVLDKLDYCASLRSLEKLIESRRIKFVKGDIRSYDLVAHVLEVNQVDTVLHFAAQTHVDNSFGNSLEFTLNNAYGTHVLLEACRAAGTIRRFVNVSTDEVYGETSIHREAGLLEDSILEPTNPYSAAKAAAEMLCKAYQYSYKMPIIITRGNNVYGPYQYPEKLVPKMVLLAKEGKKLPVQGDGTNVRSYLYVQDVAEAFHCILHKGVIGEIYNIGTSIERTVLSVVKDIASKFGLDDGSIEYVADRPFNDKRYFIGSGKLEALGWKQEVPWEEGLQKTIGWYTSEEAKGAWDSDSERVHI